jgi:hypothetical protein
LLKRIVSGMMLTLLLLSMLTLVFNVQRLPLAFSSIGRQRYLAILFSGSTLVGGYISENTTWTLANSPYIVGSDIIVESGVSLTIEPEVVVKFTVGTNLVVDGILTAQGTSTHIITFTSNSTTPKPGDWGSIHFRGESCLLDFVDIEYASIGVLFGKHGSLSNSELLHCNEGIRGYLDTAYNVTAMDNGHSWGVTIEVWGDPTRIIQSKLLNNVGGISVIYLGRSSLIVDSQISGNVADAITLGGPGASCTVQRCEISNNTNGVTADMGSSVVMVDTRITNNTQYGVAQASWSPGGVGLSVSAFRCNISYNGLDGICSTDWGTHVDLSETTIISNNIGISGCGGDVHYCNIYGNEVYDVKAGLSGGNVNASSNWWGTTNETLIGEHIYDYYDNYNLGKVFYKPYLTESYIPRHDVAINNVMSSKTVVGQGFSAGINVTVANQGSLAETFNVTVYANTTSIATQTVTLTSGNSTTITFTWNTTGFAKGNYTISAYATPIPGETDTDDNRFTDGVVTVTIAGDLDGNLAVQLVDLVILAKAYGSKPSEPPWNPNADLDDNGVVGLTDLVTLAKNYGKTDP